jgi:hypothetical protein
LRLPFRAGVVTLTEAPQVFVRARIELPDGSSHWGAAAELLAPKWFDKNLALSNEENFKQLRLALVLATDAYTNPARPRTAFGHFAAHYDQQITAGAACGLNPLVASFGPAQIDRAVLDAMCRSAGCSFYEAMRVSPVGAGVKSRPVVARRVRALMVAQGWVGRKLKVICTCWLCPCSGGFKLPDCAQIRRSRHEGERPEGLPNRCRVLVAWR